jgi:hypothetical protein
MWTENISVENESSHENLYICGHQLYFSYRSVLKFGIISFPIIIFHYYYLLFSLALQPSIGYSLLIHEVSWSHMMTCHSR